MIIALALLALLGLLLVACAALDEPAVQAAVSRLCSTERRRYVGRHWAEAATA